MKICVLDRKSFGLDISIEPLNTFGEVTVYDSTPPELVIQHISDADIIVLNKVKITREIITNAPNLKLICVFATGFDNIDIVCARERGVAVCNVPGYSTDSVALFTVANVLALYSKLKQYNKYVIDGSYTSSGVANCLTPVFHELRGRTWGLIGAGNIGRAVAKVGEALGARIIVNKRTPSSDFECVDIKTLCRESDIISIHCPLNDATRNLINRDTLALMKKDVVIVNEARGGVICDEDIVDAILNERIGAFGSDVYTSEPFGTEHPFNKIKHLNNVLLTPHAAWGAYEARTRCLGIICDNIASFVDGKKLNRVD